MKEPLFDRSIEYDSMLTRGISLSGENKHFFIHGRLRDLRANLPKKPDNLKILDFGCGTGDTTLVFKQYFPDSTTVGTDTSSDALQYARIHNSDKNNILYLELDKFNFQNEFDLCYMNGVMHHIPLSQRFDAIKKIYDSLITGGYLALFENNPINPGTRIVMSRIPFDRDAITLFPSETKQLLQNGGFKIIKKVRFLFYFPGFLKFLRPLEKYLVHLPLGAQYYVLAQK